MHRIRTQAAAFVAEQFFDLGDDEQAALWFDRIDNSRDHAVDLSVDFAPSFARLVYLLTKSRTIEARELFDRVERAGAFAGGAARARWHRAIRERLSQLETPAATMAPFRPEFEDSERIEGPVGIADFEVATACHSLSLLNRSDEARTLFGQHLATRCRTRAGVSRCLRNVVEALTSFE
jgi:hypothetical protein